LVYLFFYFRFFPRVLFCTSGLWFGVYSFISIFYIVPPRYNWNIVKSGVKHHKANPLYCLDMISVTFYHEWRLHILLTNIVWKSYRWRWGHSSISTIIHWIGCTILSDGGHERYSTNYYINRNTKSKGWTWWFTYVLKKRKE